MQTPEQTPDFSTIVHSFKRNFTLEYKKSLKAQDALALWQPRFWDHVIRDAPDLERHTNYIHYNPVKHGVAKDIDDIKRCTYRFWDEKGYYPDGLLEFDTDSGPFGE
jgi:putative transposase